MPRIAHICLRSVLLFVMIGAALLGTFGRSPRSLAQTSASTETQVYLPLLTNMRSVRFAVIGDYGTGSQAEQAVATLVHSWRPDFIATTGDNNYPSGEASTIDGNIGAYYHDFIAPYYGNYGTGSDINRFFPTLGNHDWVSGGGPYLDYFTLPGNERYYDLLWTPVQLFALDSDPHEPDGVLPDSLQAAWLQQSLAASTACWKIVTMHHAPFSSGPHGSTAWMQWPYQAWGADAVLAGHDHTYERIVFDGLPYFVNGLGGNLAYPFGEPVPGSVVRYNADVGAMLVEADQRQITFSFVTQTGAYIDSYVLRKDCP